MPTAVGTGFKRRLAHRARSFIRVGFVKELVDELGMADITHPDFGIKPRAPPASAS